MIRSMTGFGRGEARFAGGKAAVEIKTVNHKFFDETLRLPVALAAFEDKIKELLQKKIKRGKINLNLIFDGALLKGGRVSIDKKTAKNYYGELQRFKKELGLEDDITVKDLIGLPGVLNYESADRDLVRFWAGLKKALEEAVERLVKDREKEGRALASDLMKRSKKIAGMLAVIKSRAHLNIEEYRRRFAERIKDLTGGREIDMGRLEMEVAIFAKNSDISEEIARLANHLANFNKTISDSGETGKKLDFIAQELHRETNTIGSKSGDFKISKCVIEMKGEIEKIREQAKNVE